MRVLITGDFYWPIIGGAEHQLRMLAQGLVRDGHQVIAASVWHDGLIERESDEGVDVYRLKGWSTRIPGFFQDPKLRHHPPFPDPGVVVGLRRLINRFKPDIVHATGWMAYSCAVALLGKRCPLVVSVREYGYTCAVRNLMYRGEELCSGPGLAKCFGCAAETYSRPKALSAVLGVFGMRRLFRRKVAATISVSTFVRSIVRRDLYDGDRDKSAQAMVLPNIVPLDLLRDAGNDPGMQRYVATLPAEPFILYVGALRPVKGVETLITAYGKLRGAPPLVLVGTRWPDSPRDFPPGVLVLGDLPHAAVMAAWSRCLLGVVPSIWPEPLGNTVREAMCLSKPVVGTSVGGIVDMIEDEVNGLLVPPDDVAELAAAMQRLIDDPDLRARLGAAGRMSVEQLGPEAGVSRFEAAYRDLIAAAR